MTYTIKADTEITVPGVRGPLKIRKNYTINPNNVFFILDYYTRANVGQKIRAYMFTCRPNSTLQDMLNDPGLKTNDDNVWANNSSRDLSFTGVYNADGETPYLDQYFESFNKKIWTLAELLEEQIVEKVVRTFEYGGQSYNTAKEAELARSTKKVAVVFSENDLKRIEENLPLLNAHFDLKKAQ